MNELSPSPDTPPRSLLQPPSRWLKSLRFLTWALPSAIVAICHLAVVQLPGSSVSLYVALAISLGLTIYVGHFNALLRCQIRRIPREDPKAAIGKHTIIFVVSQLFLVSALLYTLLWVLLLIFNPHSPLG